MTEFNLSEREIIPLDEKIELMNVERGDRYHPMIDVEDVKEFINQIIQDIVHLKKKEFNRGRCITIINLKAGKKLLK